MGIVKENKEEEKIEIEKDSEPMISKSLEAQIVSVHSNELEVIVETPESAPSVLPKKVKLKHQHQLHQLPPQEVNLQHNSCREATTTITTTTNKAMAAATTIIGGTIVAGTTTATTEGGVAIEAATTTKSGGGRGEAIVATMTTTTTEERAVIAAMTTTTEGGAIVAATTTTTEGEAIRAATTPSTTEGGAIVAATTTTTEVEAVITATTTTTTKGGAAIVAAMTTTGGGAAATTTPTAEGAAAATTTPTTEGAAAATTTPTTEGQGAIVAATTTTTTTRGEAAVVAVTTTNTEGRPVASAVTGRKKRATVEKPTVTREAAVAASRRAAIAGGFIAAQEKAVGGRKATGVTASREVASAAVGGEAGARAVIGTGGEAVATGAAEGRIEEGDGLFEERSSASDDDQVASLLQGGAEVSSDEETSLSIMTQVMLPFLVAGLGMVGAGLVLDLVQHWDVFRDVSELFIMVPALLGLKGNLEMTLASRLSTHANLGHLDNKEDCLSMIIGNMALIQCQAIVVGFLASVAAVVMGWIPEGHFNILHALLLCAAALVTASLASLILSTIMVGVILASRKCSINPDNVATPIAASLGDLTTLGLLAWIASVLYASKESDIWLSPLIVVCYLLSLPLWVWLAARNKHTREVLYSGWTPVISAMMISSMGGLILDFTVSNYKGIAVFQPVINGVGGNLVAVQASRISTALHAAAPLGKMPKFVAEICINPCSAFCARAGHPRTARVLLLLVVPGHLVFMYTISYLKAGHTSLTPIFVVTYLLAAFLQVAILLYIAHVMVHWMWKMSIDPDNSAIPYLTALGDLLGTGLLAIAFHFLFIVGDRDADLGD
nr:solute carrier family 41 member 1-like isoform X2 [Cherax quadricarinatus]